MIPRLVFAMVLSLACISMRAESLFAFKSAEEERRFQALTSELRCLVCQNQSLADSHAELAGDLRREVFRMLGEQKSDREIIDFMVQRYGNFVLYRPRLEFTTVALWFGPWLLLGIGAWFLVRGIRKRGNDAPLTPLSAAEQRRVDELLGVSHATQRRDKAQ